MQLLATKLLSELSQLQNTHLRPIAQMSPNLKTVCQITKNKHFRVLAICKCMQPQ